MSLDKSFQRSLKLFPVLNGTTNAFYVFAFIYFVSVTNSYLLATTLFAVKKISTIIFELPTWIISDKFLGRKGTYIFAQISIIFGLVFYLLWEFSYNYMIVWSILIGIAWALHSGNMAAMLHDILKKLWKDKQYQKYNWKSKGVMLWLISFETLLAWWVFLIDIRLALLVWIIKVLIWLIASFFIKEPFDFKKAKTLKESWEHFQDSFTFIIKNPKLRPLAIVSICRKSIFKVVDEVWFEFYHKFYSSFWLGVIFSISAFVAWFWAWFTHKITDRFGYFKTFLWAEILWTFINILAFMFPTRLSPIMIEWSANISVIESVSEKTLLQKEYTDKQRATLESILSIFISLIYSILIIFIWLIADIYSLEFALLLVVLSRLVLLPFYFKLFKTKI